ncbi:MAG: threonine ammonia-lyase, biosynthetic [Gammaproteobacteria bacterium]|nr:MAG: threonine ammonia-lyase, biosynthetic [Gammaproteobacteria bacterium]
MLNMTKLVKAIEEAQVYDVAVKTPLQYMESLSARLSTNSVCEIYIKREDMQPVYSFKLRGAYNKLSLLTPKQKQRGVVAASAGNHAQGVALSAKELGISAIIVMPRTTPEIKVDAVKKLGAEVVIAGDSFDVAQKHSEAIAVDQNRVLIPPYDDLDVIAGQGTIAIELLAQVSDLDAVLVPVGGGGLLAGIASYIKSVNPSIKIIAVEAEDSACLQAATDAGFPIDIDKVGLFADGVAVKRIGELPFEIIRDTVDQNITVTTDEICAAIQDIYTDTRAIAEPAGAIAVAGAKKLHHLGILPGKKIAVILSGANMNFHTLRHVSERSEFGECTEAVFAATIDEHSGSFRKFCLLLNNRSITEFNYRIADASKANVFVGVRLQNSGVERRELMQLLTNNGIAVLDLSDDVLAKVHLRYMVGGIPPKAFREQIVSFDFPEVPGALLKFLETLGDRWNISLFHYRNHGAAYGRILAGFDIPENEQQQFEDYLLELGYRFNNESNNPAYHLFLNPTSV